MNGHPVRHARACRVLLGLFAAVSLVCLTAPSVGAQTSMTLLVRLWTVEDAPVPAAEVRVIDARSDRLIVEAVTDSAGEARFEGLAAGEARVVITGRRPDGIPLQQDGQDARGIWVRLPARDWTMDLRADLDGAVFPDLGIDGGGAVDGEDATAIAQGTFAQSFPAAPRATTLPTPRRAVVVSGGASSEHDITLDGPGHPPAASGQQPGFGGVALLVALAGLVGAVAAAIWRGKL